MAGVLGATVKAENAPTNEVKREPIEIWTREEKLEKISHYSACQVTLSFYIHSLKLFNRANDSKDRKLQMFWLQGNN